METNHSHSRISQKDDEICIKEEPLDEDDEDFGQHEVNNTLESNNRVKLKTLNSNNSNSVVIKEEQQCEYESSNTRTDESVKTEPVVKIEEIEKEPSDGEEIAPASKKKRRKSNWKRTYCCDACLKTFRTKNGVRIHLIRIHERIKPFKCPKCSKKFFQRCHVKRHIGISHTDYEIKKIFKCLECGKTFNEKSTLRKHVRCVHQGVKNHGCKECGKKFSQYCHLKFHVRTVHEGIKEFKCDICCKYFTHRSSLNVHLNTVHREVKAFTCARCNRSFTEKGSLIRHEKTVHRTVPAFYCAECDEGFLAKRHLNTHIRTFHRKINAKTTTQVKKLSSKVHQKIESVTCDVKPLICDICNRSFGKTHHLDRHVKMCQMRIIY